jgi:hypothetical protein
MKKLSSKQMKQMLGGQDEGAFFRCGTNVNCDGLKKGDMCGSKGICICDTVDKTGTLYCQYQNALTGTLG